MARAAHRGARAARGRSAGPGGLGRGRAGSRGRQRPADRRRRQRGDRRGGRPDARGRGPGRPRRDPAHERGPASTERGSRSAATTRCTWCRSANTSRGATSCRGSRRSSRCRSTGRRGSGCTRCPIDGLPAFGTPICFENSFPTLARAFVRDGAGFLVVPVNNASYGTTAASRAAPADEPDARGGERPVGRERRRLGHQRVHRSQRTRRVRGGAVPHRDPAAHDPFVRRRHVVRPAGGLVPVALARGRGRHGAGAPPALGRPAPLRSPCHPTDRRTLVDPAHLRGARHDRVGPRPSARRCRSDVDVLVVDDSSPDGTGELVRAVAAQEPRVTAARAPGEGRARRARTSTASGTGLADGYDLLVEMDSDLSHAPEELPRLLEAAASGGTSSWGADTCRADP